MNDLLDGGKLGHEVLSCYAKQYALDDRAVLRRSFAVDPIV
jgi:hypothetical protein